MPAPYALNFRPHCDLLIAASLLSGQIFQYIIGVSKFPQSLRVRCCKIDTMQRISERPNARRFHLFAK